MKSQEFTPFVDGAKRLLAEDVDQHLSTLPDLVYYGETPEGFRADGRIEFPAIEVRDDTGEAVYSAMVSGDLRTAKQLMIMTMAWSDHPGRGFEALRESLVADSDLAVVGVSFPGSGLSSQRMTEAQRQSLKGPEGDFSYISAQQWQVIADVIAKEGQRLGQPLSIYDYEVYITGKSQGTSNTVGMVQTLPENIKLAGVGLVQGVALDGPQNTNIFRLKFPLQASKKFGAYNAVNPYGDGAKQDYPDFGPRINLPKNMLTRWASHVGAIAEVLSKGGDVNRLISAVHDKNLYDTLFTFTTGGLDKIARPEDSLAAAEQLNGELRKIGKPIVAESVIWQGHYHSALENLANSTLVFGGIVK